jgi:hypothetical protein
MDSGGSMLVVEILVTARRLTPKLALLFGADNDPIHQYTQSAA